MPQYQRKLVATLLHGRNAQATRDMKWTQAHSSWYTSTVYHCSSIAKWLTTTFAAPPQGIVDALHWPIACIAAMHSVWHLPRLSHNAIHSEKWYESFQCMYVMA